MLLRAAVGTAAPQATTPAVGAAELVGAALEAFAVDPELLAAERARIRVLLVDDAQQLDPQAALLVRVLAAGTDVTLLAGDPAQAVFGFRGAEPAALLGDRATLVGDADDITPLRPSGGPGCLERRRPTSRWLRNRRHRSRFRIGRSEAGRVRGRGGGADRRFLAARAPR